MAINTDKNSYTVIFAAVMVIVVGSLLAFFASALSEKISENERLEKQQNILYAMGINENEDEGSVNFIPTDKVAGEFSKYI
jgi:Na+-transporting NADH:ubiquinone oxidoreductase subunit C